MDGEKDRDSAPSEMICMRKSRPIAAATTQGGLRVTATSGALAVRKRSTFKVGEPNFVVRKPTSAPASPNIPRRGSAFGAFVANVRKPSLRKPSVTAAAFAENREHRRKSELRKITELQQMLVDTRERQSSLSEICTALVYALPQAYASFRERGCIFDHVGRGRYLWELLLVLALLYTTYYLPLRVVFPAATWHGAQALETLIDALFLLDCLFIQPRTSFRDHGYDVTQWQLIAGRYLRSWFALDFACAFPFDAIVRTAVPPAEYALPPPEQIVLRVANGVSLLRLLRILRLMRALPILFSGETNFVQFLRIAQFMYLFLLIAHWLGLLWYHTLIKPLEHREAVQGLHPWI